jgi:hypothetical protein
MNRAFEAFSRSVTTLPTEAVLRALDLEARMLEEDFEKRRSPLFEEGRSIISFNQFVRLVKYGEAMLCVIIPLEHIEFYKETIIRLVQADELPTSAMELFDRTFSA